MTNDAVTAQEARPCVSIYVAETRTGPPRHASSGVYNSIGSGSGARHANFAGVPIGYHVVQCSTTTMRASLSSSGLLVNGPASTFQSADPGPGPSYLFPWLFCIILILYSMLQCYIASIRRFSTT